MKLDLKNKKILHELDKNARISFSEIATKIRLSKNSVINRIREMEKEEIILGYNALININNLGYTTYDIYLKFKGATLEKEKEIIDSLIKNKNVWLVAKVEGNINLSLLISTKTPEEFDNIWNKIYEGIKPFAKIIRVAILLEYHHFPRNYLLGNYLDETVIIGTRKNNKIDRTDEALLKALSQNARMSLLELSEKLKINPKTISSRLKRLEREEVILGYKINLNFRKIGYTYYKVMLQLNNLKIKSQLYNYIKANKNVIYYDKFIGGEDFEFDLEIESFEEFLNFMEDLKKKFKQAIEDYSYLNPTIIYKSSYY